MFKKLQSINSRPLPFEFYTADDLWTDDYTSKQMLSFHLNDENDLSSRNSMFIDRSVEWISSYFHLGDQQMVADFGCGPGLYTTRLAKKRVNVTGIDFSKRSIEYGREIAVKDGLSINYICQNYMEFDSSDCFDLILMIYCDFCALSPLQRKRILNKFHSLLRPGGSVLLDVYSIKAFEQRKETAVYEANLLNGFWSPTLYYGFLNVFKYESEKVMLDKYTIIEPDRARTVYNWLQYFSLENLEREFFDCGFGIEGVFNDVAGTPFTSENPEFAIIAKVI